MKHVLRIPGILAFVIIVLLIVVSGIIFTDKIVKTGIESTGSQVVGAKVEVDAATVNFSEQAITLAGFRVTDPDEPMRNALDIEEITFDINVEPLVYRQVHIDKMVVAGVNLNTPRKESGAIISQEKPAVSNSLYEKVASEVEFPHFELPSVDEVLAEEQLQTLVLADQVGEHLTQHRQNLDKKIEQLPSKEALDEYKLRIEKIKSKDKNPLALLNKAKDLKQLKKDIKKDLDNIRSVRKDITAATSDLKMDVEKAKKAPLEDLQRLQEKYNLSPQGLRNLTSRLFGKEIAGWVDQGWGWYQKLQPFLGSAKEESNAGASDGDDSIDVVGNLGDLSDTIHFAEQNPMPDFLIKHIVLSGAGSGEKKSLAGEINDLNSRPSIWARPITLDLKGNQFDGINAFALQGNIDRRGSKQDDSLQLDLKQVAVNNLTLSDNPDLPVIIETGNADIQADYAMQDGALALTVNIALSQAVARVTAPTSSSKTISALAKVIEKIDKADFNIHVSGALDDLKIALSSDLDSTLSNVFKAQFAEKAAEFKAELKTKIQEKTQSKLSALNNHDLDMKDLLAQVDNKNQLLEDLLGKL